MKNGPGVLYFNDSSRYEGNFSSDFQDGLGTLYYPNGDKYVGDFSKGKQTGRGAYYYHDGNKYEGELVNLIFTGKGTFTMSDGSYYEGEFKDDKQSGEGAWYYSNGDIYIGTFSNGSYNGCGTYYYSAGDQYTGDYLNNQSHGIGIYTTAEGEATEYHYDHGNIVSEGMMVFAAPLRKSEPVQQVKEEKPPAVTSNPVSSSPEKETKPQSPAKTDEGTLATNTTPSSSKAHLQRRMKVRLQRIQHLLLLKLIQKQRLHPFPIRI
jgi:hypothetical protein